MRRRAARVASDATDEPVYLGKVGDVQHTQCGQSARRLSCIAVKRSGRSENGAAA